MNETNISECNVKWDVKIERAKHIFKELGINFLSQFSQNFDSNIGNKKEIILKTNKHQLNDKLNNNGLKINECSINGSKVETHFNDLSDELMVNILKYLSLKTLCRCSQVSKRWKRIAFDSTLWKNIDLSKTYLSFSQLNAILKNGVISLRLSSAAIIDCQPLDTICSYNCIEYLDLSMAQISVQSINKLLDFNFTDISLKKLSLESLTINQSTIDLIVNKHKGLEVLNISMTQFIDNQVLMSFNDKLPEDLIELNISWITNLDSNQIIKFLPNSLKRLNLSGFKAGLEDTQMDQLVTICPNLIELDLSDCILLTEHTLHSIETHLTNLEILHISRCHRITDLSSLLIMKNLKILSIHGISFNQYIDWDSIQVNNSFISTIARSKSKLIDENYSSIWEIPLKIFN